MLFYGLQWVVVFKDVVGMQITAPLHDRTVDVQRTLGVAGADSHVAPFLKKQPKISHTAFRKVQPAALQVDIPLQ